jgi:hypothetical protein
MSEAKTEPVTDATTVAADPPATADGEGHTQRTVRPPSARAQRFAERTRRLQWLIGGAIILLGAATVLQTWGGHTPDQPTPQQPRPQLPITTHTVVYEVTGPTRSPEIRFVTDGTNATDKVEGVKLPWRKELKISVGPGPAIVQVMAANGQADAITCSVTVDGAVVNRNTAPGQYSNVSCSGVVRP